MTSPMHVFGRLAPPTNGTVRWAPPLAAPRVTWSPPTVWPAPRVWSPPRLAPAPLLAVAWAPPVLMHSSWPAPAPLLELRAPAVAVRDAPVGRHPRAAVRRGRSLAYAIAGVAAAAVGFAVIVVR